VGGTVGDIESLPFLEAMRQFMFRCGNKNAMAIHVTLVPTSPPQERRDQADTAQREVTSRARNSADMLICRSDRPLSTTSGKNRALYQRPAECVIDAAMSDHLRGALVFAEQEVDELILEKLDLTCPRRTPRLEEIRGTGQEPAGKITIGVCGKYTEHKDAYKSIAEASCTPARRTMLRWSSGGSGGRYRARGPDKHLQGSRDCSSRPASASGHRRKDPLHPVRQDTQDTVPGHLPRLQCAVIEFARNVCGLDHANSLEFRQTDQNVIDMMLDQRR